MKKSRKLQLVCAGVFALGIVGCHPDMWIQPKYKAQEKSEFFDDHMSSRLPVDGTVPFEERKDDDAYYRGYVDGQLVEEFPVEVTRKMIERGQERFEIFCRHCHGAIGDGTGMISQRGYNIERPVASYHSERLREMPVGHFFDVITNGYSAMYPFKDRISVEDRWAIVAYIRVLQRSQIANADDLPNELRTLRNSSDNDDRARFDGLMAHPNLQILMNSSDPKDRANFDKLMADPELQALMVSEDPEDWAKFERIVADPRLIDDEDGGH